MASSPGFMPTVEGHPKVWLQEYPGLYSASSGDLTWHIDGAFLPVPPRCSVLYALDVPEKGGDTIWADLETAYNALSEPTQEYLSKLTAVHDNMKMQVWHVLEQRGGKILEEMRKVLPPTAHPLVRTHPETGRKSLMASPLMTTHIPELSKNESDALLAFLFEHVTNPEFQCRLRWRKGTAAFWDNRCTIHRGVFDFGDAHRLMHRVSIEDDQPPS